MREAEKKELQKQLIKEQQKNRSVPAMHKIMTICIYILYIAFYLLATQKEPLSFNL